MKAKTMDTLELLLAAQIRERAAEFRQRAFVDAAHAAGYDRSNRAQYEDEWNRQNPYGNQFIEMAVDELTGIAQVVQKRIEKIESSD